MASKYLKKFPVPSNFPEILHDFAREILRDQPADIIDFGHEYFKAKDEGLDFDYPKKGKNIPPEASRRVDANAPAKKETKPEKKEEPKVEKKEEPKKEEPKKEEPKKEEPKKEEPKKEEPKKEEPKKEEPKKEEVKKEEPKKEKAKTPEAEKKKDDKNQSRVSSAKQDEQDAKQYVNDMIEKLSQDDEDEEKDDLDEPKEKAKEPEKEAKKVEPKKDEPKKDEPKKDEPKKDEPKKDEPKKEEPSKETKAEPKEETKGNPEEETKDAPSEKTEPKKDEKVDPKALEKEANDYHQYPIPGKYEIATSKEVGHQKEMKLAYVPGVAIPCQEIAKNEKDVYKYTNKDNTVCVISNGTAVLGLGNIGALASKPVMEGKGVLLKKFGDVNGVDLEVDTTDPDEFVNCVKLLGSSYGGINLEDIKGPECFYIENKLKEIMDIPVFHDDQHGTAIITAAGVMNACHLTNRKLEEAKVVFNGAGAAGIACLQMLLDCGVKKENAILCDSRGIIYKGRKDGMNEWKEKYVNDTEKRKLEEALEGADVFVGVSKKDALNPEWITKMNGGDGKDDKKAPIIFALANPDPEIRPEKAKEVCPNVIIGTGRSDYPNQINNVMCFPYLFRGALDVRAKKVSENMKIATAKALAELAREDVPKEVNEVYGRELKFGPEYIIPTPFDPRLLVKISTAVAKAACDEGNAMLKYQDWSLYEKYLNERVSKSNML